MLISVQSTHSYRIGSSMNILWMCVCVCVTNISIWLISMGQAECMSNNGKEVTEQKKTTTRASWDCCFWRQSSYLKQDMQATHTHSHIHIHTESRTNRSTRQPQPQPQPSRLLWFRLRRRLRLHVHYINPVPVPVRFFSLPYPAFIFFKGLSCWFWP